MPEQHANELFQQQLDSLPWERFMQNFFDSQIATSEFKVRNINIKALFYKD
jgi:hypothetical protein